MSIKDSTFVIYGKENCPHCVRAKETAKKRGLEYEYLTLGKNYEREELIAKCAPVIPTTVPRIFMDGKYIGTCDEFVEFLNKNS